MKQAILLHGTGGSDTDYFWFADVKSYLEKHGYQVWWPALPNTDNPSLTETTAFLRQYMPSTNEQTIIVAHSSACPLILSMLPTFQVPVKQVVLVAGYYKKLAEEAGSMLPPDGFDWQSTRPMAQQFVFINSDNDPWKCTDEQARDAAKALQSPLIVAFGQGHMGSGSFNQPYREFPLLTSLLAVSHD